MTQTHEPSRALDPAELRPGGGCGCGAVGCITLAVALCIVLLGVVVLMALLRPGMSPPVPQMR
jgi:hypothetical protein